MPVEYVTGDLFSVDVPAIGQGVNCRGVMGSGIAPLFKKRWPAMFTSYREECLSGRLALGGLHAWVSEVDGFTILNMASQFEMGANASLDAVEKSLRRAVWYCELADIAVFAIPRIGSGIGGLRWDDVKAVIERVGEETVVTIVVVSLPQAVAQEEEAARYTAGPASRPTDEYLAGLHERAMDGQVPKRALGASG